jgi:hypothetical protein
MVFMVFYTSNSVEDIKSMLRRDKRSFYVFNETNWSIKYQATSHIKIMVGFFLFFLI